MSDRLTETNEKAEAQAQENVPVNEPVETADGAVTEAEVNAEAKTEPTESGEQEQAEEKRFCIKCGAELLPDQKFCPKCGANQTVENNTAVEAFNQQLAEKKKKKKKLSVLIPIAALLIVGAVFGIRAAIQGRQISAFLNYLTKQEYSQAIKAVDSNAKSKSFVALAEKRTVKAFESHIKKGEITKAADLYNNYIVVSKHISTEALAGIEEDVIEALNKIEEQYNAESLTFEAANKLLSGYKTFNDGDIKAKAEAVSKNIEAINNSIIGYQKGVEYYEHLKAVVSRQSDEIDDLKNNTAAAEGTAEKETVPLKPGVSFVKYTVKAGDSLSTICRENGIDLRTNLGIIQSINGLKDVNSIFIGQVLLLPQESEKE